MAIGSKTSIDTTQIVLPKHDVEPAGSTGQSKEDRKREQAKRHENKSGSHPTSNAQGQLTGILIDVSV